MKKNKEATVLPIDFEDKLRATMQKPGFKGRVIKDREIYRDMGVSKTSWLRHSGKMRMAQIFIQENPTAPIEVKEFYLDIINKDVVENTGDQVVIVNKKKHTITKSDVVNKSKTMKMRGQPIAEIITPVLVEKTIPATEDEVIIEKIRKMYVMAPVGEMPNVTEIMKDLGLIDSKGLPTGSVTEEAVREKMIADEWRNDRTSYLHKAFDIIPDEVKMYRTIGGLEREKKMHQEFNVVHNLNQQWFAKGRVMSLDKSTTLDWKPDVGALSILAETIRRLASDGPMVAIQINNGMGGAAGAPSDARASISAGAKAYMQRLNKMTPEELKTEADKLDSMIKMLAPPEEKITINDINTQDAMDLIERSDAE
jgi:hypothetical protein